MLEARGITKSYGDTMVLSGAGLKLEQGECLGLAGANGSGKSTLMRIISQIISPDSGEILCDGKNVIGDRAFLREKLGYVPQEDALAPFLTVSQQLKFWQGAVGASNPECEELLGLCELWKKRVGDLSGGQKKRVSVALAMQSSPEYLIMDEAFSSLSAVYRERVGLWVKERVASGMAVLWCSHDAAELRSFCARCVVLSDGKSETMDTAEATKLVSKAL